MLAGGLGYLFSSYYPLISAGATHKWPTATGTIQAVEIEENTRQNNPYAVILTYQYEVAGQTYTNDIYSLDTGSSSRERYPTLDRARTAATSAFGIGDSLSVHYNPESPNSSVLVPGIEENWLDNVRFYLGILLTGAGVSSVFKRAERQ